MASVPRTAPEAVDAGWHSAEEAVAAPDGDGTDEEEDARYRVDALEPATGQTSVLDRNAIRSALSWTYLRGAVREDPVFGALLALLVLQALLMIVYLNPLAIVGGVALVWGVLTMQRWAYWLALIASAILALYHFLILLAMGWNVEGLGLGIYCVIIVVNLGVVCLLLARRNDFG
jgi:hypothetical protein